MQTNWNQKFLSLAKHIALWSKDRSTKVGCVIIGNKREIVSTGYNGFPRGINDDVEERHERPTKYQWTEHAERNAIYNAALIGTSLRGCTLYTTLFPCIDCTRGIIQSGIKTVVTPSPDISHQQYGKDFLVSLEMLQEAGIAIVCEECD